MIKIRQEAPSDISAIKKVNDAAFGQENEANLIHTIRKSPSFVPELSLVAENEEIVGHILFTKITIETENGSEVPSLALAPMAVKPEFQKEGIGSQLVREGLKRCREHGYDSVIVLGHPEFYPKFGFVPASTKGIKPPFTVPDEVFMLIELKSGALDEAAGVVKYPPAFMNV
ncbi:GNAT family N-acetyltransferase [Peribacillus frigoritolerans]|uniref:GNAT family N-acetyltransferase n=1 Tax=Peribacillus frigoritolerans TaxID=450367 RepID=UPI00105A404B|nr:N-acetyltransferase [Peribacillus frigoritolerans]TDL80515.1 N-acetyltransferase [Peribacillus frigoritolerans]